MENRIGLVIATPCFGGQVSAIYAASIFKLQSVLRASPDIALKVRLKDSDALITRARANLCAQFLDDPDATHLLFIDADIGFEPDQAMRLIGCGADLCAAIYPIKRINWDRVKRVIAGARPDPGAAALSYVFEVEDPEAVTARAGFVKVLYAGTGFLMIRRGALQRMCAHYPQLRYRQDHSIEAETASENRFALFDCMIDENGTYLSEDFSFCRRWRDIGGEIWADLSSTLNHVGPLVFRGDLSTQFATAAAATGAALNGGGDGAAP